MKFKDGIQKLSVKLGDPWHSHLPVKKFPKANAVNEGVSALQAEAENILDSETRMYHKLKDNHGSRDFQWVKKILQAGTLSDKISAHTMLLQDSPVYNLRSLEVLVGMVTTKGKRECLMAMDALQGLFSDELLLEDRKLRMFKEQPLDHLQELSQGESNSKKGLLILWIFEEKLKFVYGKFLKNVVSVSHDTIEKTKMKAVTTLAKLLIGNCEEEQFLLESLANKIGDPAPKVGSHACHQLSQILKEHAQMKSIVVQEVERLVFRPNVGERAKYYSLCFLNQIILSHDEFQLANHLITIYFGQFKLFVRKGEVNTKMMSALLSGVTRAYPYAKLKENVIAEQLDAMYRLVHMVSFNISVQALMLIFQVLDSTDSISDRFYCVLYRKLLDPALGSSSRQSSVLNLIYRALKKDVAVARIKAFVKRLLQVALYQDPNLQCGILVVISELNKLHPNLMHTKPSFQESDSDSDEHYEDLPDEDEKDNDSSITKTEEPDDIKPSVQPSWIHRRVTKKPKPKSNSSYNLDCRNPLHANAESQNLWELLFLKQSFHPSVSLFAHQVANSAEIKYSGDPLLDFTTARFLDRFVYRNPKKPSESFQSDPKNRVFGGRKLKETVAQKPSVISDEYLRQSEKKIPIEELFMYKYLKNRKTREGKDPDRDDSDIESVCSEDFQHLLDNIHPEDEGKDALNFAKELGLSKQKKGTKRNIESEEEDEDGDMDAFSDDEDELDPDLDLDDEDDAFLDIDDNELDICEDDFENEGDAPKSKKNKKKKSQEFVGLSGDMLADAEEFTALLEENNGNALDGTTEAVKRTKKTNAPRSKKNKKKKSQEFVGLSGDMLADAEEFTALLEENNGNALDGTTEAVKRTKKTSVKQLQWEMERDRFMQRGKSNMKGGKSKNKFHKRKSKKPKKA